MIWGYHYFRNHPYTPPKTDVDKRNSNVWKGIYTLKKNIIFGIYVRFQGGILPNGGEQRWFTTVKSVKQSPNQTKVDPTGTLRTTGWMYTGYHTDHQVFFSGFLNHQQYSVDFFPRRLRAGWGSLLSIQMDFSSFLNEDHPIYQPWSSAIWKGSRNPILRGEQLTMVMKHWNKSWDDPPSSVPYHSCMVNY